MNLIVQIIILGGPLKPGNTDSVSQNFKRLGKLAYPRTLSLFPSLFRADLLHNK